MREIKFRAWDTKFKKMVDIYDHKTGVMLTENGLLMSTGWDDEDRPTWDFNKIEPERYIFDQFTGLKDSKGVDIYEGDILKAEYTCLFVVEYNQTNCCFVGNGNEGDKYGYYTLKMSTNTRHSEKMFNKVIKVIGNIHENKELIEDGK